MCDQCGDAIVVTESNLVVGNCVIFVDHRDAPELDEPDHRVPCVQVLGAIDEVVRHEEDLCPVQVVSPQVLVVGPHEMALSDRRERLQREHVGGTLRHPEFGDADRDRSTRDHDDLVTGRTEVGHLRTEARDRILADRSTVVRDRRRTDFDDESHDQVSGT